MLKQKQKQIDGAAVVKQVNFNNDYKHQKHFEARSGKKSDRT